MLTKVNNATIPDHACRQTELDWYLIAWSCLIKLIGSENTPLKSSKTLMRTNVILDKKINTTWSIRGSWVLATLPQKLSSTSTTLHPNIWKYMQKIQIIRVSFFCCFLYCCCCSFVCLLFGFFCYCCYYWLSFWFCCVV